MKRWQKLGLTIPIVAALAGGSWAWAADKAPTQRPSTTHLAAAAAPAAALDTAVESKYTPITPCRIVDTRRGGGGRLPAGATRAYHATGTTGFAPQGGLSGGCGIPTGATAVAAAVVAVNPAGGGYLKVYPSNQAAPLASFLNYNTPGATVSSGGTLTLCTAACTTADLKVSANIHATDLVIDIQGYYNKPLTALINTDGRLIGGSRVTASRRVNAGIYLVTFDRDVTPCDYAATPLNQTNTIGATSATNASITAASAAPGNVVQIEEDKDDASVDGSFYVTVTC